jgi:hypothetical protein
MFAFINESTGPTPITGITCWVQPSMNTGQNQLRCSSFGTCRGLPTSILAECFLPCRSLNVQVSAAIASVTELCFLNPEMNDLSGVLAAIRSG